MGSLVRVQLSPHGKILSLADRVFSCHELFDSESMIAKDVSAFTSWGVEPQRPQCGMKRGGSPMRKGAWRAPAKSGDYYELRGGAERPQCGMKRGGSGLSKRALQATVQQRDYCEADRPKGDRWFESNCHHHPTTLTLIQSWGCFFLPGKPYKQRLLRFFP